MLKGGSRMTVKRLFWMVVALLTAFAVGMGNLIAVIDHYVAEVEYIVRMALGS